MASITIIALILLILSSVCHCGGGDHKKPFLNIWAVQINGRIDEAHQVANRHHYELVEELEGFSNVFIMRKRDLETRLKRHATNFTTRLSEDPAVLWAEQQMINVRVKRGYLPTMKFDHSTTNRNRRNETQTNQPAGKKFIQTFIEPNKPMIFGTFDASRMQKGSYMYNDELWPHQWYINNPGLSKADHGITQVWDMGYTGSGIVVSVLDDGLEWRHSDLRSNYDHNASVDVNDGDEDPSPRYDIHNSNAHGTRCAGEIAMAAHNRKCGVGIAFNAKIGGIRCLDGDLSDMHEARALSFNRDYIDIYSSSWGPSDDGKTVDGPKMLAGEALERGTTLGRSGKGSIFVWASGNGGSKDDNCNCDGYVSSIYTISIGSVSESGQFPWYGEKCASTLAVAYSSGAYRDRKIPTTDIHDGCTMEHSGTSAAAPIAAGILALVLEANPNLTWRDVQHLIVCTSEFSALADNKGWKRNAAGFLYNSQFGFGLLMAKSMVQSALMWETVPDKTVCLVKSKIILPLVMTNSDVIKVTFSNKNFDQCPIRYLEHVQVRLTLQSNWRGNLRMFLYSPQETLSVLMHPRKRDNTMGSFHNWNLTSVQFWGENPFGDWKFFIQNAKREGGMANLGQIELILHGTSEPGGCLRENPHRRYLHSELIPKIIDPNLEYNDDTFSATPGIVTNLFNSETFPSDIFRGGPPPQPSPTIHIY